MQIPGTYRVFKYYFNTEILGKYLNAKFKVFKYCRMT